MSKNRLSHAIVAFLPRLGKIIEKSFVADFCHFSEPKGCNCGGEGREKSKGTLPVEGVSQ
jgi:hypothetical protein